MGAIATPMNYGYVVKKRRASLMLILSLLFSLFLLSVLSNILTGYQPEPSRPPETPKQPGSDVGRERPILVFKVSPITPELYWSVFTADYYTGFSWLKTTDEKVLEEIPQFQDANATEVFTVEINMSSQEILLPMAPPNSVLSNISSALSEDVRLYGDAAGNVYKVKRLGQEQDTQLAYKVLWREVVVDDRLISPDNIPEAILNRYFQLPHLPIAVWELAEDLKDSSYSVLDQVLADVQFLRTNFVYDVSARFEHSTQLYEGVMQGSDVYSYIERRKGVCLDAATALAIILRIQKIPARVSIGYKPGRIEDGKLLYYTTGAHAVAEVYLPPYGWVQFDATPPLEEDPLLKVSPFKQEYSPGSRLFCQLSIANRRNSTDNFKLFVHSKQEWKTEVVPEELGIEALQTADALLEVTIPDDADLGEKDVVTTTVVSMRDRKVVFSVVTIIQVANTFHIPTTTTLKDIDEAVFRGDALWIGGAVLTTSNQPVDNMTIFILLTKSRKAEGIIIGRGYSKQGNFEIESKVPNSMEIGDYKIITISLGTKQHAPSDSDSIIKVRATTTMEFCSEEEFLLGYGAISGRLLWDNGAGFANTPISLQITSLPTTAEVWKLHNLTFEDGSFRIETNFENPGVYEVKAMFSGNEYILGSNATHVVKLILKLPTIQILSENTAIRGEVFCINGTIRFEDVAVSGALVTVAFDNKLLAATETMNNGSFARSFLIDSEEKLGLHILTVTLRNSNLSAVHRVLVKSKTTLTTKVSDVAGGMFHLFSASLSDDHNVPIQGADIAIKNYGLSGKTDNNGNLTLLLNIVKFLPENLTLTAKFESSELYLLAATENKVVIGPVTILPFLIPLVSPTFVVMVVAYAKHHVGKQTPRQISDMEVVAEKALVEEEPSYTPQEMQPLKIVFPDIEAPFPNVWGVKDKLRIEILLDASVLEKIEKSEVEVSINEETLAYIVLSRQVRTELLHVFIDKGEHRVRASTLRTSRRQLLNAEVKLRVVDYGEEIIRLYNEFLGKLASQGISAPKEMTALEIESLALRMGDFSPEAVHEVTTRFEKAEYSNHVVTREDYEVMYLSLKELNINVE